MLLNSYICLLIQLKFAKMQIIKSFSISITLTTLLLISFSTLVSAQREQKATDKIIPVNVPSTEIKLSLPDVFVYDDSQMAYIYSGAAASINVKELKGTSFNALIAGTTKESIEHQGMKLMRIDDITLQSGMKGKQYTTSFSVQTPGEEKPVEFKRIIFFAGNDEKSVWIMMNYPVVTENVLEEVLRSCLLTVEF